MDPVNTLNHVAPVVPVPNVEQTNQVSIPEIPLNILKDNLLEAQTRVKNQTKMVDRLKELTGNKIIGYLYIEHYHNGKATLEKYQAEAKSLEKQVKDVEMLAKKVRDMVLSKQEEFKETQNRIERQEAGMRAIEENIAAGGSGGFIPPYMQEKILAAYKAEAVELSKEIHEAEQVLKHLEGCQGRLFAAKNRGLRNRPASPPNHFLGY